MLGVPNVAVILGEGGSGGAIAIATANRVLMLEHAIYSVISPEGAASILWRDTTKAQDAATNMKITAAGPRRAFGVIDGIVPEPVGGAHRDPAAAIAATGEAIGQCASPSSRGSTARPCGASAARNSWRSGAGSNRPRSRTGIRIQAASKSCQAVESLDLPANSAIILPFVHPTHAQSGSWV